MLETLTNFSKKIIVTHGKLNKTLKNSLLTGKRVQKMYWSNEMIFMRLQYSEQV